MLQADTRVHTFDRKDNNMATKKGLTKGLISSLAVLGVLLGAKVASAADCQQVMVFKDGIQEYAGPNTSTGVVVRGSATVRVRLYCTNGKQGSVTSSDLPKKQDKPQVSEKKAGIEVVLISAFAEFEGSVSANPGETKNLTFTDGSGTAYTVTVQGKHGLVEQPALDATNARVDGKADKGDVDKKADKSYVDDENKKQDTAIEGKADKGEGGGDGRIRLELQPAIMVRPSYDPMGGLQGIFRYRVGNINEIGFEFAAEPGWAHSSFPTRPVAGVPYTEDSVSHDAFWLGLMALADFPVGSRVNFKLGGGLRPAMYYYPGTSVGQEANGGSVWAVHNSTYGTLLLQGEFDFQVYLSGEDRKGFFLGLGAFPGIQLVPTKSSAGGVDKDHKFEFIGALGLGYAI